MKSLMSSSFLVVLVSFFISACQAPTLQSFKDKSNPLFGIDLSNNYGSLQSTNTQKKILTVDDLLTDALATENLGPTFKSAFEAALSQDPLIVSGHKNLDAAQAAIRTAEARKDFQVAASVYGGVEDVTDQTKGIAVVINASKPVFDGGMLDAQISERSYLADSARQNLRSTYDDRAMKLGNFWIELEKYEALHSLIDSRLDVLDPLIAQLEKVARAGIGDVSKVASAQRTVAEIRVAQTRVVEGLAQARLNYVNAFGGLPSGIDYDHAFVRKLVPNKISESMVQDAPVIASKYASYMAQGARIRALEAKDEFNVNFEVQASRPFAGSSRDSDESIGLIAKKTIFNGGMFASEIDEANAKFDAAAAQIKASYREGSRVIETAKQNIKSMEKAISLAKENADLTSEEIVYLKQQLVIGGSTLESVLSAESRLYEAESKEINFTAEMRKSELSIVSTLGLFVSALDLDFVQ